jgi:hypothetical protein
MGLHMQLWSCERHMTGICNACPPTVVKLVMYVKMLKKHVDNIDMGRCVWLIQGCQHMGAFAIFWWYVFSYVVMAYNKIMLLYTNTFVSPYNCKGGIV